ncbi:MAG: tRNA (adenine(22)-N(1))-methyltransferase TrmK [Neptuniibacter sp.]
MKRNSRLSTITSMVTQSYDRIWDCCCDHGQIGIALLRSDAAATVHFVDIVPSLIDTLQTKLTEEFPLSGNDWKVHCADLNKLKLPVGDTKNLIIIAGVGGDLTITLVQNFLLNNSNHNLEFILCPVRHNFKVRQAMKELNLGLINESLVFEKGLFYEVMHITSGADKTIKTTGSIMWDFSDSDHQRYLEQNIEHYQRASRSNPQKYTDVLSAYQALKSLQV